MKKSDVPIYVKCCCREEVLNDVPRSRLLCDRPRLGSAGVGWEGWGGGEICERKRGGERERDRDRQRHTERQTDRQAGRQAEKERGRDRERQRHTERQTDRQTETDKTSLFYCQASGPYQQE